MNQPSQGDTRGEEVGALLPPPQEPGGSQGPCWQQQDQRSEPTSTSPPGVGHGVRGAHAGRDLARAGGGDAVYEILKT